MQTALNHILSNEAQNALDATWQSGSFFGHDSAKVSMHWGEVNFLRDVAEEKGDTEFAAECVDRMKQIEAFLETVEVAEDRDDKLI